MTAFITGATTIHNRATFFGKEVDVYNRVLILTDEQNKEVMTHALDLNYVGAGTTVDEALEDLREIIQFELHVMAESPDAFLVVPADKALVAKWEEAMTIYGPGLTDKRTVHEWLAAQQKIAETRIPVAVA